MTIRAADLREGDQIPLVVLTVGSVIVMEGSVYVEFSENGRIDVFEPDHPIDVIRGSDVP